MTVSMPPAYGVARIEPDDGMALLRSIFPKAEADPLNFVLFSTSGVHGSYLDIEDVEKSLDTPEPEMLTVLIVRPQTVFMQYGSIVVTKDDIKFLKKLRASSRKAVKQW